MNRQKLSAPFLAEDPIESPGTKPISFAVRTSDRVQPTVLNRVFHRDVWLPSDCPIAEPTWLA